MNRPVGIGHLKRLQKEYYDICARPEKGISVGPRTEFELFPVWDAWILGPENTPYKGGIFQLEITFPLAYPFKAPKMRFITRIVHCNISRQGVLNLDVLGSQWSPALTVQKVLLSIHSLLICPNPNDPLVSELGVLLLNNPAEYDRRVTEATRQFAIPQDDPEKNGDA